MTAGRRAAETADTAPQSEVVGEVPDLSEAMYCEHSRTRRYCEHCQTEARARGEQLT